MYSKEELKEMLDSVIHSNGVKGITGDGLNAVLSAIIDSVPVIYKFPEGIQGDAESYIFSPEETAEFRAAWANRENVKFVLRNNLTSSLQTDTVIELPVHFYIEGDTMYQFYPGGSIGFADNGFYEFIVEDNGDFLTAYFG